MRKFGVSIPDEIVTEIDQVADSWFTDRSKAIVRIYLEWKQLQKLAQFPHSPSSNGDTEAPDASGNSTQKNPNPNTLALAA